MSMTWPVGGICQALPQLVNHERHVVDAVHQGLTLVHIAAQLKHILWDRGASRDCLGGVSEVSGGIKEYEGVFRGALCQTRLRLS